MTGATARRVADHLLWICIGGAIGMGAFDVAHRRFPNAIWDGLELFALFTAHAIFDRLHAVLDGRMAVATAELQLAQAQIDQLQRLDAALRREHAAADVTAH